MTKYVRVDQAPEVLSRGEMVIHFPNFVEEVRNSTIRRPQTNTFGTHYTRALAEYIATQYEPEFDVFKNIRTHAINDVPFANSDDIAKIMFGLFQSQYPKIFDSCIETKIKAAPFGTKLIYYVGPHQYSGSFDKLGIEAISAKDIETYMDRKPAEDKVEPAKKNPPKKS